MKIIHLLAATLAVSTVATGFATPALAQSAQQDARFAQAQARFDREYQIYKQEVDRYQAERSSGASYRDPAYRDSYNDNGRRQAPDVYTNGVYTNGAYTTGGTYADDRNEGNYDPSRYYRPGTNYQERTLSANERVYAGSNGQYYCKRSDGTTGLIVGAAGGGVLGNIIDGGHSRTVGTLLGAALGGLAGRAVDQNNSQVRCR